MDDLFGEMKLRKHFITDTQRQQLGKALREAGFGRDDFDWEERRSGGEKTEFIVQAIVHKERGYYYTFHFTDGGDLRIRDPRRLGGSQLRREAQLHLRARARLSQGAKVGCVQAWRPLPSVTRART